MENKLNKLLKTLKEMGYGDYVLNSEESNIIIKFENVRELTPSDKDKLKDYNVKIKSDKDTITITY